MAYQTRTTPPDDIVDFVTRKSGRVVTLVLIKSDGTKYDYGKHRLNSSARIEGRRIVRYSEMTGCRAEPSDLDMSKTDEG